MSPTKNSFFDVFNFKKTTVISDLPKKILSGEVNSAILNNFPSDDYKITSIAAVSQIALMGKRSLTELNGRFVLFFKK